MHRVLSVLFSVMLLMCCELGVASDVQHDVIAISYHDVRDDVDADIDADSTAVSSRKLAEQFEWLRKNGYTPISITQLQNANAENPLPHKAVLLTFDDGYESTYNRVFPLLKLYGYPAVVALVGSWLDVPAGKMVRYGDENVPRNHFLSTQQIREMQKSGLVEFASHSYELHKGVMANPQGNVQPAAVTAIYDQTKKCYESAAELEKRVYQDLKKNHARLRALTGVAPRVIAWPYGEWSEQSERAARSLGYEWFLLLGDMAKPDQEKHRINRYLVTENPDIQDFSAMIKPYTPPVSVVRAAHVDLDYVYDSNPAQMNANIDKLLERIKRLKISTVYLQAFADPDGDGNADALYFPNRYLPVRADLFNRVAWQLHTRANVHVYAWMPVIAFEFGEDFYRQHGVRAWTADGVKVSASNYKRLSIFDKAAREKIRGVYQDLALHAAFQGVLFHDDALLDSNEDFHPAAVLYFSKNGIDLKSYASWKNNNEKIQKFTVLKTQALNDFTAVLLDDVRNFRPEIRSARNLYAATVLNPESEQWFAQNIQMALHQYDYVALMAMPWMEESADPEAWTRQLIAKLNDISAQDKKHLVIELQSKDWRNGQPISSAAFREQVSLWKKAGYQNYAWYTDDFIANVPEFSMLYSTLSLEDFPYQRR
jgi:biofilm PGA synthesis lipoprotein PgaB